jgi:hypothetical protein
MLCTFSTNACIFCVINNIKMCVLVDEARVIFLLGKNVCCVSCVVGDTRPLRTLVPLPPIVTNVDIKAY